MATTNPHIPASKQPDRLQGDRLNMPVRELMTASVVSIPEEASLTQALWAMRANDVHAVLVTGAEHGAPLGWITARGQIAWTGRDTDLVQARDAVTERAHTIAAGACARDALAALSQAGTTHLLVIHGTDAPPEGVLSAINLAALEHAQP